MRGIKLVGRDSDPDTHTHTAKYDDVREDHPTSVEPDDPLEAQQANGHSSQREEDDEGEGRHDRMSHANGHEIVW